MAQQELPTDDALLFAYRFPYLMADVTCNEKSHSLLPKQSWSLVQKTSRFGFHLLVSKKIFIPIREFRNREQKLKSLFK